MIAHQDIEDALLDALAMLHLNEGGPLRTLDASGAHSLEDALATTATRPAPACMVLATESRPSELRPGNRHEVTHTITLLLAARSFRSRQAAARGTDHRFGVYDLLTATKQALMGRLIFGPSASELQPGRERLMVASPSVVIWGQEWTVTIYH